MASSIQVFRDFRDLRIAILGTPRIGNHWLFGLLASCYSLPMVELPVDPLDLKQVNTLDSHRWLGWQHYQKTPSIIGWMAIKEVDIITIYRHPCDVFVSLVHYARHFLREDSFYSDLLHDGEKFGPGTCRFARTKFPHC